MSTPSAPLPQRRAPSRIDAFSALACLLLVLVVVGYCAAGVRISMSWPLWMDEVLAVWIARLQPAGMLWTAVAHGAEFSPATYHFLLRAMFSLFGDSRLTARLPSLVAALIAALCVLRLLHRRVGFPLAAMAMGLTLSTGLLPFAIQARQYALVAACFAIAAALWDVPADRRPAWWRMALLWLFLSLSVALHFYGVLVVAAFGVMEALWAVLHRRLRWRVWGAIALSGLSTLAWLPLMARMMQFNTGDVSAPNYYARPTLPRLVQSYADLLLGRADIELALLLALAAVIAVWAIIGQRRWRDHFPAAATGERPGGNADIVALAALLVPLIGFVVALLVTGTYNERYVIVASIGAAILVVRVLDRIVGAAVIACLMLLMMAWLFWRDVLTYSVVVLPDRATALLERTGDGLPIMVAEGLRFFEIEEAVDPPMRQRLVYVTLPDGVANPDPTNENQVKRWIPLRPDLRVETLARFFAGNPRFHVLSTENYGEPIVGWLRQHGAIRGVSDHDGDSRLLDAVVPP